MHRPTSRYDTRARGAPVRASQRVMVRGPRTSRRRLGRGQLRLLCSPPPLRIGSGATVLLCLVTSVVAAAASLPAALAHGAVGGWTHGYHTAGHTAHGRHLDALAAHVAHGDGDGGGHFACGVGTPFADAHTLGGDDAAVTSKAQYHTLDHGDVTRRLAYLGRDRDLSDAVAGLGRQRRAQDAEYATRNSDGSTFLPLSLADDLGLSAGIRIEVLWEVVEGGDFSGPKAGSNARQCTAESELGVLWPVAAAVASVVVLCVASRYGRGSARSPRQCGGTSSLLLFSI